MSSFYDLTIGQQQEFHRIIDECGLTKEIVELIIKDPTIANKMLAASWMARQECFGKYLYQLDRQKHNLAELNEKMPRSLRAPKKWIADLHTLPRNEQQVSGLLTIIIVFEDFQQTIAYGQKLIELIHPAVYESDYRKEIRFSMIIGPAGRNYQPGVHVIDMNLVDNCLFQDDRDIIKLNLGNKTLDIGESMFAYALQDPRLIQMQDGILLPYNNLGGLQLADAEDSRRHSFETVLCWGLYGICQGDSDNRAVNFNVIRKPGDLYKFAVASVKLVV